MDDATDITDRGNLFGRKESRMKLIDKDDFINRLIEDGYFNQYQIEMLQNMINTMPTEDIVRCKDCKYHEQTADPDAIWCDTIGAFAGEYFFCAEGKRAEE